MPAAAAVVRVRSTHLGDDPVDRDRLRRRQRLGALQPGQLQQLLDEPAEPGGLVLDPLGEPAGGDEVLGRGRARASAGSVASSSASASSCSAPTGVFSSWLTLATKSRRTRASRCASVTSAASTATWPPSRPMAPQVHAERVLAGAGAAPGQVQLDLAADAGAADLAGEGTDDGCAAIEPGVAAGTEQAHRPGGRVDQHRRVVGVEHHHTGASASIACGRARRARSAVPDRRLRCDGSPALRRACGVAVAGGSGSSDGDAARPPAPRPRRRPPPTPRGDGRVS